MPAPSLETVTEKITAKLSRGASVNARVKFDFGDEGRIFVDATQSPPVVSHDDAEADTTLLCSIDTFAGFMDGSQDPNIAFLMGKLKVQGSMGIALKLNAMLED
ncbi:MAG: SCP2 sterol-binding domain-containing protein [Micavibrio sp.]